jgi:hypothetical protein
MFRRYAELVVGLGRVLREDGWEGQLDKVSAGPDAKTYALATLRRAVAGDLDAVTAMIQESAQSLFHLSLDADGWLREGLMHEVLNIQPSPEPPPGWEGNYCEEVGTLPGFLNWLGEQVGIIEMVNLAGVSRESGSVVRNAYCLIRQLNLTGMPPPPSGDLSAEQELAILRQLIQECERQIPTPQVAQAAPLPESINRILDPTARQRATDAWQAASQLRRLMEQWETWFHELQTTGDADPGLASRMAEAVIGTVKQ